MELRPGKLISGKYRLERSLDAGGMGTVWIALHTQLDTKVAIKFMAAGLQGSSSAEARFELEAKAESRLKSPHIIQVHDYGVAEGVPYMVMEFLEGKDLGAHFSQHKKLSVRSASKILTQAARGLQVAHDSGIVHRDLKPKNIFLARSGTEVIVKLLDFGIAKVSGSSAGQTSTGVMLGSPSYMSPEQAYGAKVDHRCDLWSLGVVTFEAITGERPFVGRDIVETLTAISLAKFRAPSSINPFLSPGIDAFFERALAREPEERFASAQEMAEAFAELAAATPEDPAVVPGAASHAQPADESTSDRETTAERDALDEREPSSDRELSGESDSRDDQANVADESSDAGEPSEPNTGSLGAAAVSGLTVPPAASGRRVALRFAAGGVLLGLVVFALFLSRRPPVDRKGDPVPAGTPSVIVSASPTVPVSAAPSAGPSGSAAPQGTPSIPPGPTASAIPTGEPAPGASAVPGTSAAPAASSAKPKLFGRLPVPTASASASSAPAVKTPPKPELYE